MKSTTHGSGEINQFQPDDFNQFQSGEINHWVILALYELFYRPLATARKPERVGGLGGGKGGFLFKAARQRPLFGLSLPPEVR